MKRGYTGFLVCKRRIMEQLGKLNELVQDGEINPYTMDRSSLLDYTDSSLLGNLMSSPVWRNTIKCWFFRQYKEEVIYEEFLLRTA